MTNKSDSNGCGWAMCRMSVSSAARPKRNIDSNSLGFSSEMFKQILDLLVVNHFQVPTPGRPRFPW